MSISSQYRYRKLTELTKLKDNPRTITEEDMKILTESIKKNKAYFEARPLILSNRTGKLIIIAGNQRYEAAGQLKLKEVPTFLIPNLTREQEREIAIRDNINNGKWDKDMLAKRWSDLPLRSFGISSNEFKPQTAGSDNYELPEKIKTSIKKGDIYQIGNHRIMCGDSANKKDVEKLMDGAKGNMVFTDPPYGVSIGAKNRMLNSFQKAGRNLTDIKDDSASPDELYKILLPCFVNLREACADNASYYVTSPQGGGIGMMMMMMMMKSGLEVRHVLIWKKNSPTFSMGRLNYDYAHEPIFYTWTKKHNFYGEGSQKTSIWEIDKPRANKEHPTMKPIELINNALLNSSKENDIIVDLFMGSGSTMVASQELKRKCYGMEITPEYCQVTINRMKALDPSLKVVKL